MKKNFMLGTVTSLGCLGVAGMLSIYKQSEKKYQKVEDDLLKFREFYDVLLFWLELHQAGGTVADYFKSRNIKTIAIYGMRELGNALENELRGSNVVVEYGIDRDADYIESDISLVHPEDALEKVDAIVITALHYYTEIMLFLRKKTDSQIVSLDDVVYEALQEIRK